MLCKIVATIVSGIITGKKSVHVQGRHKHLMPSYIVHIINNITFFPSIFNLQLAEFPGAETRDIEVQV